jgi:hypothetical protein
MVARLLLLRGSREAPAGPTVHVSMAEIEKKIQLFRESLPRFEPHRRARARENGRGCCAQWLGS